MKTNHNLSTSYTTSTEVESTLESTSKTFRTTFAIAVNWLKSALIMCNNIWEIDPSVIENTRFSFFDEDGEPVDIYQWFITDCTDDDVEYLEEHFGLLFTYSELLDLYILCVDHLGTSWDYVYVDTDLEYAEILSRK